ncbi:hypothetical protein CHS0354_031860 [Potamilus streckersoni]|uniref:Uncharacterized protein n=1 Tax=Potamilus streckersoni TaxID=2493646 RepID=A0AAE0RXL5_9BIVA|nr:hypothetical protein CHS0354_031860 [Potamilus streckersoni]
MLVAVFSFQMARQESGKHTIFCLTGFKKNDTEPVPQKHVHFIERELQTFTETKKIREPFLEYAPRENLNASSSSFLDKSKEKKRIRPNLKKILNIWDSWNRKSKFASHLQRPNQMKVDQRCKSETDLTDNLYELEGCHIDYLKRAYDQPHRSDRNNDNIEFMRPVSHNVKTVQEKINSIPDERILKKGILKESNAMILNRTHVATHPSNPNPQSSYECRSPSGRKVLDVTRKNEIRDIVYESTLAEVKKPSPKAMMLRGILNRIRTAGTENVTETTTPEQQRVNSDGNIDKREQEPETDEDLAEFLSGVDAHGMEQFFSFCDKIILTESKRYSCMTASEFAAKRKKDIDMSHKQGNASVQGLTSVNLNSKTSTKPNREFVTKNPKPQLSLSVLSTDESSLEFETPLSSTPVIADSFRGRLFNSHISSIFTDPDTTDTEQNDMGQSFDVQPKSASIDMSSSEFWRSEYVLPPNTDFMDHIPKISKCDRKSVNNIGKTDIVFSKPSQIRRQTKDFARSSTIVHNSIDVRSDQKLNLHNYSKTTCDVNQRSTDKEGRRPMNGVIPAMKLGENSAERYKDWDYLQYPIHDNDSGCGHSMNSESVFLGNI